MSHDGARELDSDYVAMVILNEKRSRNFLMLPTYLWLQCLFFIRDYAKYGAPFQPASIMKATEEVRITQSMRRFDEAAFRVLFRWVLLEADD